MPTKLITPASATLAPTAIATRKTIAALRRCRRTPRWNASASRRASASSPRNKSARQEGPRREQRSDGGEHGDLGPARPAKRTHRPEGQIAQLPVVAHIGENAN